VVFFLSIGISTRLNQETCTLEILMDISTSMPNGISDSECAKKKRMQRIRNLVSSRCHKGLGEDSFFLKESCMRQILMDVSTSMSDILAVSECRKKTHMLKIRKLRIFPLPQRIG